MPVLVSRISASSHSATSASAKDSKVIPRNFDESATLESFRSSAVPRSTQSIRAFDVMVALAAIVLFLPVMLLIALFIKGFSSGPAIFCQRRIGQNGIAFPCFKFRTMVVNADAVLASLLESSEEARREWERDQKLRRDPRVTYFGEFLRRTSLDELPQLFNVLAGHMSVVGPRPIVESEIVRYGSRFRDYCSVRPGLTGLWQINGRNDVSYGLRVRLDSFYARHRSLSLNIAICVKTVPAVLASRGCY